jgi:flavodoxin
MKTLVVYDSNFGNTKKIAEAIAETLKARAISVKEITIDSIKGIELLIVGSPINAWRPTTKIKDFLDAITPGKLSGIKAAAFDTRVKIFISGNAAKKISKALGEKGAAIISDSIGFYVKDNEGPLLDGEITKAQQWAADILQKTK